MKNAHFNSDGNSMRFVSHPSKTGFSALPIKTAVHRAQYFQPCGRHRFARILILLKNINNHAVFFVMHSIIAQDMKNPDGEPSGFGNYSMI